MASQTDTAPENATFNRTFEVLKYNLAVINSGETGTFNRTFEVLKSALKPLNLCL